MNFLPHVQRVLYGEEQGAGGSACDSSIRVFLRDDVQGVRITLDRDGVPIEFRIAHVDLYFFFDLDVLVPVVEICGQDLDLATAQDVMFRFGRAYPPHWDRGGRAGHLAWRVEWLAVDGSTLSSSDYEQREKYLGFVGRHRSPWSGTTTCRWST